MFGKRSMLGSGKLAKKRRRRRALKLVAFGALTLVLVAGSAYGLSRPEVTIQEIVVSGTEALAERDVRSVAEDALSGKYLYLFPKRSALVYPRRSIEAAVARAYTRVRDVDVSREGFQSISINVQERMPYAVWCAEKGATDADSSTYVTTSTAGAVHGSCYFLDDGGYIFTTAPRFSGDVYFRYYGALSGDEPVGRQFLTESRFRELTFFFQALLKLGINPTAFYVHSDKAVVHTATGMELRFAAGQDLARALTNLESALSSDVFQASTFADVEYIDLRFGNRVFYRFR